MAGLNRSIDIVRLFDQKRGEWTVKDMATELSSPVSTIYRNVRELAHAGFLEALPSARYCLGPAFVEFERRFRLTDPLVHLGSKFLQPLLNQASIPCVVVLARLYRDQVMCTVSEQSDGVRFKTSYERGRPMPLLRGATSKVILAQLRPRRLERMLQTVESEADLPDRESFLSELSSIRKRGHSITRGEVDKGLVGLAAPIVNARLGINASLSVISDGVIIDQERESRVLPLLVSTAQVISNAIAEQS